MSRQRAFHPLPVAEVVAETADACSLVLAVPPELAGAFAYRPGQFLTVRVPRSDGLGGAVLLAVQLTAHRGPAHDHGQAGRRYASNWIADHVRAGTVLDILPPAGTFTPGPCRRRLPDVRRGSGITPVMSIVKSVLARGRARSC